MNVKAKSKPTLHSISENPCSDKLHPCVAFNTDGKAFVCTCLDSRKMSKHSGTPLADQPARHFGKHLTDGAVCISVSLRKTDETLY